MHYQKRYNGELLGIEETISEKETMTDERCGKSDSSHKKIQKNIVTEP